MKISDLTLEELSREIAERIGWKPRIEYWASRDGGESLAMTFTNRLPCNEWCAEHPSYETVRKEIYPRYSDPEIAMRLLKWIIEHDKRAVPDERIIQTYYEIRDERAIAEAVLKRIDI